MNPRYLLYFAIFSNFFGGYIIQWYQIGVFGSVDYGLFAMFPRTDFYYDSLIELCIIFTLILFYEIIIKLSPSKINRKTHSCPEIRIKFESIFTFFIFAISFFILINIQIIDASLRGVDQNLRNVETSLSRVVLLLLPLFIFYAQFSQKTRLVKLALVCFFLCIFISQVAAGNRRILIYFVLAILCFRYSLMKIGYHRSAVKTTFRSLLLYSVLLLLLFSIYYFRSVQTIGVEHAGFVFLGATLGALGSGLILQQVQEYVSIDGYLFGETFVTALVSVFIPSVIMLLFTGSESLIRSSSLFDYMFNTYTNMGFDFMLVSDFYWNFGYLGYSIFIGLTWFVLYYMNYLKDYKSPSFGYSLLLFICFFAGLRSDLGFFIKTFTYLSLFYFILIKLFTYRVKSNVIH